MDKPKETIEEMASRLFEDEEAFMYTEALRIFYHTENEMVAIEALKLIKEIRWS